MLNTTLKTLTAAALVAGSAMMATAQEYTIRATANSNENDEDADGLNVFKQYVEAASNGASSVNCDPICTSMPTISIPGREAACA